MLGPGEEHHVGEGGDHGQEVDDCEGEKHGVEECVDLCTACTRIDQLSLLPETRLTEAEAGQRRPPWRRRRLGAVGGVEGDEVQHVGDGADEGEDGRDEGDEKTEKLEDDDEYESCTMYILTILRVLIGKIQM